MRKNKARGRKKSMLEVMAILSRPMCRSMKNRQNNDAVFLHGWAEGVCAVQCNTCGPQVLELELKIAAEQETTNQQSATRLEQKWSYNKNGIDSASEFTAVSEQPHANPSLDLKAPYKQNTVHILTVPVEAAPTLPQSRARNPRASESEAP